MYIEFIHNLMFMKYAISQFIEWDPTASAAFSIVAAIYLFVNSTTSIALSVIIFSNLFFQEIIRLRFLMLKV